MKVKNKKTNVVKEVEKKLGAMMIGTGDWEEVKEKKMTVAGLGSMSK